MELELIKLLTYGFIGIIAALFIYITALALFLYNKMDRLKDQQELKNRPQ
jgi:hypothetical protein